MKREVRVFVDAEQLAEAAASEGRSLAQQAVASRGIFTVALAGGSTPRKLYSLLAEKHRSSLPWDRTHLFWGDERFVPSGSTESTYSLVEQTLLSRVQVPPGNIHRVRVEEGTPERVAELYAEELRSAFWQDRAPEFDLVLLGVGSDGHTASLFPGSPALDSMAYVVAVWVEVLGKHRITLTLPVINNARTVLFLVSGSDKAEILRKLLRGEGDSARLPAALVRPDHDLLCNLQAVTVKSQMVQFNLPCLNNY